MNTELTRLFVSGAISALLPVAWVDFKSFRAWKNLEEARKYDWGLAAWRWFQAIVVGGVLGIGVFGPLKEMVK